MGQFTFSVSQSGQPDLSKSVAVPDGDVDRIVAAYQSRANTMVNGTATRQQVFDFMLALVIQRTNDDVAAFERAEAEAAIADPPPLGATPEP